MTHFQHKGKITFYKVLWSSVIQLASFLISNILNTLLQNQAKSFVLKIRNTQVIQLNAGLLNTSQCQKHLLCVPLKTVKETENHEN